MTISATTQGIKPGVCTSTNRPSAPFDGQVIYMTDVDQTAVWDGSQWTVLAPIAGGRNAIINGAMNVWQRGTSSASQGYVTADRWFMLGASTTFSQETSDLPSNFRYALKCTMSGTAQPFSMQAIETQNSIRFAGKTVVLSYYVKTSNSTDAFLRIDTSNNVDETIQGSYSVIASTSVATTTSWTRVSATFSVPSTSKTLRILVGSNSNLTSGQTILITGVQLEAGAVATPFEFEDYGTTLAKCQRYYFRVGMDSIYSRLGFGQFSSATVGRGMVQAPITLRSVPSSIEYASLGTYDQVNLQPISSLTLSTQGSSRNMVQFDVAISANGSQYRWFEIVANTTASAYFGASAEL